MAVVGLGLGLISWAVDLNWPGHAKTSPLVCAGMGQKFRNLQPMPASPRVGSGWVVVSKLILLNLACFVVPFVGPDFVFVHGFAFLCCVQRWLWAGLWSKPTSYGPGPKRLCPCKCVGPLRARSIKLGPRFVSEPRADSGCRA